VLKSIAKELIAFVGDLLLPARSLGKVVRIIKHIIIAKHLQEPVREIHSLFQQKRVTAKLTGAILAFSLVLNPAFHGKTISLTGFSLGCQVAKSCIKTLHQVGAHQLIHNVTLMGGATSFKAGDLYWNKVLSETIGGTLKNVHTSKDIILLLFAISSVKHGIGRNQIFTK
jgi:hypothetical protein